MAPSRKRTGKSERQAYPLNGGNYGISAPQKAKATGAVEGNSGRAGHQIGEITTHQIGPPARSQSPREFRGESR